MWKLLSINAPLDELKFFNVSKELKNWICSQSYCTGRDDLFNFSKVPQWMNDSSTRQSN
jgi:hypothetical protein